MSDVFTTASGTRVRLMGNNILVRPDKPSMETPGGIVIPDNVLPGLHITGEVLALGFITSKKAAYKTPIPGLRVGDRVLFLRFHERLDLNDRMQRYVDEDLIRIRPSDILLVMDGADVKRLQ